MTTPFMFRIKLELWTLINVEVLVVNCGLIDEFLSAGGREKNAKSGGESTNAAGRQSEETSVLQQQRVAR